MVRRRVAQMHAVLWAALAVSRVSLFLQPQTHLPDTQWPTHAVATVPQGWIKSTERVYLLEDDKPIPAQVEAAAQWPDGSPKWLHVYAAYRYRGGKPCKYVLMRDGQLPALPVSPLRVTDQPDGIRIDTGVVQLQFGRPFGSLLSIRQGDRVVAEGPGGPAMVDQRGLVWHAKEDPTAELTIEQQGPTQVTIRASGWYQTADKRVAPFCRYVTRITVFANSPLIKFDHATIFAEDMRKHAVAELGFHLGTPQVEGFTAGALRGKLDDKLAAMWFAHLGPDRMALLAQRAGQPAESLTITGDYERSPGWFCADRSQDRLLLMTRDFWQKYPKEVSIGKDGISFYAWPKHGDLAPASEADTELPEVYKFRCFHQGKLLDSRLPNRYFTALERQTDTTECRAVYARAANLSGVAMHNEFALAVIPRGVTGQDTDSYLEALQQLYTAQPIARVSRVAMAASGVFGPVAATGAEFPEVETAVRDGMLGYARSIERYGNYGWAIYGNTHSEELMNPADAGVPGGRPSLHRVWNNNHYQHVSTAWRLAALNGDPRLLDWARLCTDYYASIGQVRYDALRGRTDGNGKQFPGPEVKFHMPGAFWHCKALVPWGCRDYGMDSNDADSGLTGHWPDPSGLLMAWLFDANRWAKEGYDLWLANVKFPKGGQRREINTSIVHAITAYDYQPNPEILAAIQGMAAGLRSQPIMTQQPGPIWEPTWLSRYYEFNPNDKEFVKFILESAEATGMNAFGIWSLALSATAYDITKDEKYLRRHFGVLERMPRRVFRDPHPDKRWDLYGMSPGPSNDGHLMLQWHRFSAALKKANIKAITPPDEPGHYFCGSVTWNSTSDVALRGTKILCWRDAQPAKLNLELSTLGSGDFHPTFMELLAPGGKSDLTVTRLPITREDRIHWQERPSSWRAATLSYPVQSQSPGLYALMIGSHQIGVFQPVTELPECQILRSAKLQGSTQGGVHLAKLNRGFLVPLTKRPMRVTFTAMGPRDGSFVSLFNAQDKPVISRYLRAGESIDVDLNRGEAGTGPWRIDNFSDQTGFYRMSIAADVNEPLLFGRKLEDIELIRSKLPTAP